MRKIPAALISAIALVGCDAHLSFHGSVSSASQRPLSDCSYSLMSRGRQLTGAFDAPQFGDGFAVSPWQATYKVTIACAGHAPKEVAVPRRGGSLGNIILVPADGT